MTKTMVGGCRGAAFRNTGEAVSLRLCGGRVGNHLERAECQGRHDRRRGVAQRSKTGRQERRGGRDKKMEGESGKAEDVKKGSRVEGQRKAGG